MILSHPAKDMKAAISKVSPYAAAAGPKEFGAEVFTAAILGTKLPKELHMVRDLINKSYGGKV